MKLLRRAWALTPDAMAVPVWPRPTPPGLPVGAVDHAEALGKARRA